LVYRELILTVSVSEKGGRGVEKGPWVGEKAHR
jgi:hypothetical protein